MSDNCKLPLRLNRMDIYPDRTVETYWSNWVLVVLKPGEDRIDVASLDWFNKSGADFGYVWPTRVVRSKRDGRFYGQGIRMEKFVRDCKFFCENRFLPLCEN